MRRNKALSVRKAVRRLRNRKKGLSKMMIRLIFIWVERNLILDVIFVNKFDKY
jgi:hypothetical protein